MAAWELSIGEEIGNLAIHLSSSSSNTTEKLSVPNRKKNHP
jgi:hypothetical protein